MVINPFVNVTDDLTMDLRLIAGFWHGMMALNAEWMMPVEQRNQILNRSTYTRHLMFLVEHWDEPEETVVEFVIYTNGEMSLDRVDDWYDDTQAFLPQCWEPT